MVNGDDFGYSAAIDAAIVRCHTDGILTSATLLVNRPATDDALELARRHPSLGVGLHLNLTEGTPVLPPALVPSLVDRQGQFVSFPRQFSRIATGQARLAEVERELRAQFELVLARGLHPTHVDGHLHVHAYPRVLDLVVRLMADYQVCALRSPLLLAWLPQRSIVGQRVAKRLVGRHLLNQRARLLARSPVVRADRLFDLARFLSAADPVERFVAALTTLPAGGVEVMAHPAWNRDAPRGASEVALLTDPRLRAAIDARGIERVHYGQLINWPAARCG